jgi:hypothetical protein
MRHYGKLGEFLKRDMVLLKLRGIFSKKEFGLVLNQVVDKVVVEDVLDFGKLGESLSRNKKITLQQEGVLVEH